MTLPAMSFGNRFCMSRKGGIGEVGECMAISGPSFRTPWLTLGGPLLFSYAQIG